MALPNSNATLSSLYSTGQCLLSVLGSIGVILLFAGIPQLIYSPHINPGSVMTFLLGALLISLMVGGNAFIGYKYRLLVRNRRERETNASLERTVSTTEDKPPTYDDILFEDGLPPTYSTISFEKPPKYDDVPFVFNWPIFKKSPSSSSLSSQNVIQFNPSNPQNETPIIVPIQINLEGTTDSLQSHRSLNRESVRDIKDIQSSPEDGGATQPSTSVTSNIPSNSSQLSLKSLMQTVINYSQKIKDASRLRNDGTSTSTSQSTHEENQSQSDSTSLPTVHVINETKIPNLKGSTNNDIALLSTPEENSTAEQTDFDRTAVSIEEQNVNDHNPSASG